MTFAPRLVAALLAATAGGAHAQVTTVVEFYNQALDHYFVSLDPAEIDDLDSGRKAGWSRTGLGFGAALNAAPGTNPVCRFYLPPGSGDSHFFSASPAECAETQAKFPQLILETPDAFNAALPDGTGACPADTVPVYRLWNGRADSNHRYTADTSVRDEMIARGYTPEGYGAEAVSLCAPTLLPALPLAPKTAFAPPVRITQGGTYTGNWESQDPTQAAVTVDTTDPVIVENCVLRGRTNLVNAGREGVNVTIRNCRGYGLDPRVDGQMRGAFFEAFRAGSIVFEHNYQEGLAEGLVLIDYRGRSSGVPSVVVRYNRARNLMGLYSDGKGGTRLDGDLGNEGNGNHWVILSQMPQLPGAEIAWNEIVNDPYISSVGDKINVYKSSGSATSPIDVHDNFVYGGYGIFPLRPEYSGGGVITDGSGGDSADSATAYVNVHNNQFVNAPNFGVSLAAGHDNTAWENRGVSTGRLPNGQWMATPYGNAVIVWNGYHQHAFANNVARDNVAGWIVELTDNGGNRAPPPTRHDYYLPDCATAGGASLCTGNASLPGDITGDTEASEIALWRTKLRDNAVTPGPVMP